MVKKKIKDKEKVNSNGERTVGINSDVKELMVINDVSFIIKLSLNLLCFQTPAII